MTDIESKYKKVAQIKEYTGKYSSKSKSDPSKQKRWIGKELLGEEEGPFGFCEDDEKSPVAEAFSQSLAVELFGKDLAAKTKFSQTERMIVSRMPEGESADLSTIVENAVADNNTTQLPSGSIAQAMAFKIIMEDDDANLGNFIISKNNESKESFCFPIDGDCSFTKQDIWDYDDFKSNISSPKKLAKDLTSIEHTTAFEGSKEKEEQALGIITNGVTSEKLVEAIDSITTKLSENNFKISNDVVGEVNGEKGILPDIKKGYDNGVYSLDELNFASEKLREYQNELKSSVERFSGFVKEYKKELKPEHTKSEEASHTGNKKRSYQEMVQESKGDIHR